MPVIARLLCATGLFLSIGQASGGAPDEPLTKVQVGKIGKAATVLVESRDRERQITGSAFCIHPSGLFVTNEHVALEEVRIVLNPGLKGESVHKATVVRSDKEQDLALLRVDGVKDLPHLSLGSDEKLTELTELVAIGFPFGNALRPDRKGYPEVSVNVGSITSLRRKDDSLHRIQLDAALNPGNSGGPVLDMSGKVVGVVVSGVKGSGVNFAIPVNLLASFVARPDVAFNPPRLGAANVHKSVAFEARVVPLLKPTAPITVELSLKTATGKERTFPMEPAGETYTVSAVPLQPPPTPTLRLVARFDNGSLNATMADAAIKVGDRDVKLSEIKTVETQPATRVVLHDGKSHEGAVSGLNGLPVRLGEQSVPIDLSKAAAIRFSPDAEADHVWCVLTVRQGATVIQRQSEMLSIEGLLSVPSAPASGTGIKPPVLEGNQVILKFPSPVTDVAVGGGGRYLVLHMPKARKLAIFDVNAGDIVGHIPVEEEGAKFAAGQDTVVVVLPAARSVERWNLKTREREVEVDWPFKGTLKTVAMGSASKGPLLVQSGTGAGALDRDSFSFFNVETMKVQLADLKVSPLMMILPQHTWHLRASPDGKLFSLWCSQINGWGTFVISDVNVTSYYSAAIAGFAVPSADGKSVFTMQGQFRAQDVMSIVDLGSGTPALPARHGDTYLRVSRSINDVATIYAQGKVQPLASLKGLSLTIPDESQVKHDFLYDKRIHLIPDARVIVVISALGDRLTINRLP